MGVRPDLFGRRFGDRVGVGALQLDEAGVHPSRSESEQGTDPDSR